MTTQADKATSEVSEIVRRYAGGTAFDARLQVSLPALVDQATHVLTQLEAKYKLVSKSAMIRVDQGVEFHTVCAVSPSEGRAAMKADQKNAIDAAEQKFITAQINSHQWTASGCGWVTRSYVNEVTTSLDIGMYTDVTTSKTVETFAAHIAKVIVTWLNATFR